MTLTEQELRWAQKDVFNAGNNLASAGLRLHGTEYEKAYERVYKAATHRCLRHLAGRQTARHHFLHRQPGPPP